MDGAKRNIFEQHREYAGHRHLYCCRKFRNPYYADLDNQWRIMRNLSCYQTDCCKSNSYCHYWISCCSHLSGRNYNSIGRFFRWRSHICCMVRRRSRRHIHQQFRKHSSNNHLHGFIHIFQSRHTDPYHQWWLMRQYIFQYLINRQSESNS